jgi:hypothetical protein
MCLLSRLAVRVSNHMAAHIMGAESLLVWSREFESTSGLHIFPCLLMMLYQYRLNNLIPEWEPGKDVSHFFSESVSIWNLWICSYCNCFLIYLLSHSTVFIICLLAVSQRTLRGSLYEPLNKPSDGKNHWKLVASSLDCSGMHRVLQCDCTPNNEELNC